jgi:hypothetical protein
MLHAPIIDINDYVITDEVDTSDSENNKSMALGKMMAA